jgi:cysteine desulfuration protein SufE
MTIDEIRDNFELLDEWDDRYRYVIELGRTLEPLLEEEHSPENKVQGCVSQVWLSKRIDGSHGEPRINYRGDSDAHIVRGLVAIVLTLFSGRTPKEILSTDALAVFEEFGFREHLTPQRSNGLRSMVERIKTDAREALADASSYVINPQPPDVRTQPGRVRGIGRHASQLWAERRQSYREEKGEVPPSREPQSPLVPYWTSASAGPNCVSRGFVRPVLPCVARVGHLRLHFVAAESLFGNLA